MKQLEQYKNEIIELDKKINNLSVTDFTSMLDFYISSNDLYRSKCQIQSLLIQYIEFKQG